MEIQLSKYEVRIEPLGDRITTLMSELLVEHWQESAKNKTLMVLNPDVEKYAELEKQGALLSLFAYADGELVGYSLNFLQPHIHYADLLCSYNDVLFIKKGYRESPLGLKLIRKTEEASQKCGAELMLWHAKEGTTLDKLLPRMGCRVQEIMYCKEL